MPLDGLLVPLVRLVQRQIHPAQPFLVPAEPRLRGPVQQREAGRIRELSPLARAEVGDDLGVPSGRGELLSLVDYE